MAAHQALLSLGFSKQEHWSGLPFPSPMRESEVTQLCSTLSDPMDCRLPGSSVHGIFQARVLELVATAFSKVSTSYKQMNLRQTGKSYAQGVIMDSDSTSNKSVQSTSWVLTKQVSILLSQRKTWIDVGLTGSMETIKRVPLCPSPLRVAPWKGKRII